VREAPLGFVFERVAGFFLNHAGMLAPRSAAGKTHEP
jgi:hypothetical protein